MTPEGKVKAQVKQLLTEHGCYYFMPVQNGLGAPALDFFVCHQGRFAAIETKAGKALPTPRQRLTASNIKAADGAVFVVNEVSGMDELRAWLNEGRKKK